MLKYVIRRILLFVPTVFIITLAAFIISTATPGDPVMRLLGANDEKAAPAIFNQQYKNVQHQLGLDLPVFYISCTNAAMPKDVHSVFPENHREFVKRISRETGNGVAVMNFYRSLNAPEQDQDLQKIIYAENAPAVSGMLEKRDSSSASVLAWKKVLAEKSSWKKYIPVISFNSHNQYHRWLFGDQSTGYAGLIKGDFGTSLVTGKKVTTLLKDKSGWTIFFTLGGILISLLIAVPSGIYAARYQGSRLDKNTSRFYLLLHSMPSFFTATLLLMIFANPHILGWFPASGTGPVANGSFGSANVEYLVLPLICYALASMPFIARSVRTSMISELDKEYILTARAKGLDDDAVVWKHAFRNSLFPLITLIAYLFPAMIGGSAILETVFSLPGMGLEIVQAIYSRDYPVIIAVFTITGILTVTGYLVSDLLYAWADPRIQLNR